MADDRVLLITGASSGIGAQIARRAAEAGYRLVLGARREEPLVELAAELGGEDRALAVRSDVTDWDDVQELARTATERFGRLDAVAANAGFGAQRGFLEESPEHWRSMVLTNVLGVALTIRATLPILLGRERRPLPDHRLGRRPPGAARARSTPRPSGRSAEWPRACARSCGRSTRTTRSG